MTKGPTVSNIAWIAAIVLVLTFLIVVVAWMSSGKLKVEDQDAPKESAVAEQKAEPKIFIPETGERSVPQSPKEETSEPTVQVADITPETPPAPEPEKPAGTVPEPEPAKTLPEEKKEPPKPAAGDEPSNTYALQLGAFSSMENARAFEKRLAVKGYSTTLKQKGNLTAVLITGIKTSEEARKLKEKLEKENISSSLVTNP